MLKKILSTLICITLIMCTVCTPYASETDTNIVRADYSNLAVGTYTESKSGTNCQIQVRQGTTGSFSVNTDGSVTLKQSDGNENVSFIFQNTPRVGKVVSTYKIKFDVMASAWTRLEYASSFSSLCVTGNKFTLNNTYKVDSSTQGSVDTISSALSQGVWYTVSYLINNDDKTYKLDITDENGDSIITSTTDEWSFRPQFGGAVTGVVGNLSINTAQGSQCEISLKDIFAYQVNEETKPDPDPTPEPDPNPDDITIATSPASKPITKVNFETDSAPWNLYCFDPAKGSGEVVDIDGNKIMKLTQYAGYEDAVVFNVNGLYSSSDYDSLNIKERLMFEKLDTGYTFLRTRAAYLYIENNKWGINYGGGKMITTGTKESITTNTWYNLNFDFDFPAKKFDLVITKDDGTVVFEDYDCDFRGNDTSSLLIQTPHKDGRDANGVDNTTVEDTIICIDDIIVSAPGNAVYYTAKASENITAGKNEIAVSIENLSGTDRTIGAYVPVYNDGILYTVAGSREYFTNGSTKNLIVSYDIPEDMDVTKVTYDVIVADDLKGMNHSVVSSVNSGTLTVNASTDFANDAIIVNTDNTFDNGTILVLTPGATPDNATPNEILYYALAQEANIKVADDVQGNLTVFAMAQNKNGEVTVAETTVYYPGNGTAKNLITDFNNATESTIAAVMSEYMAAINAANPGTDSFYAENASSVNDALIENKPYETLEQIINVIKSVKSISLLRKSTSEIEFEEAFNQFALMYDVNLDDVYQVNKENIISTMFAAKDTFGTYEDVINAYKDIYIVCDVNSSNENTIGAKLEKYAQELNLTLDNVYTSKQVYIARLMVANIPFANKFEISVSYNDAYENVRNLQGSTNKVIVASSADQPLKIVVDFEDMDTVSNQTHNSTGGFTFSPQGGGNFDIVTEGNSKHLTIRQSKNSGTLTSNATFNLSSVSGNTAVVEYQIRFDTLSSKWTMFNLGNISSLFVNGKKFGLNEFANGSGNVKTLSDTLSEDVWYNIVYNINFTEQTYTLVITDEFGNEIANVSTKPRFWQTQTITNPGKLAIYTPQNSDELCEISIDDVRAYSVVSDHMYYDIIGTESLLPGINIFDAEFLNTYNEDKSVNIYVSIYEKGKLHSFNKLYNGTITANSEEKHKYSLNVPYELFGTGGEITYDVMVLEEFGGLNYGIKSSTDGKGEIAVDSTTIDYDTNSIVAKGTTTYDNITVLITAPVADEEYDIDAAKTNNSVIAYYAEASVNNGVFDINSTIPDRFSDGDINIYLISQNNVGEIAISDQKIHYFGRDIAEKITNDFNNATIVDITNLADKYMHILTNGSIEMQEAYHICKDAVNADILANQPYNNIKDIVSVFTESTCISYLEIATTKDEFEQRFITVASYIGINVYEENFNMVKDKIISTLFDYTELTPEIIRKVYTDAITLYTLNNITVANAKDTLIEYSAILDIDTESNEFKKYYLYVTDRFVNNKTEFKSFSDIKSLFNGSILEAMRGYTDGGYINENIIWSIVNGNLNISGSGEIPEFTSYQITPWYNKTFGKVYINDGITNIPKYTVYNSYCTEVYIGKDVDTISNMAFIDNIYVKAYNVSADNPYFCIENEALYTSDMTTLIKYPSANTADSFDIPETVTKLYGYAFDFSNLRVINIKGNITNLGTYSFNRCEQLESINVENDSNFLFDRNGVLYVHPADGIKLACYPPARPQKVYTVPGGAKFINYQAFAYAKNLETVILSPTVTNINNYAFYNSSVKNIFFGKEMQSVGYAAFYGTDLRNIYYTGTLDEYNCTAIDSYNSPIQNTDILHTNGIMYNYNFAVFGNTFKTLINLNSPVDQSTGSFIYATYTDGKLTDSNISSEYSPFVYMTEGDFDAIRFMQIESIQSLKPMGKSRYASLK